MNTEAFFYYIAPEAIPYLLLYNLTFILTLGWHRIHWILVGQPYLYASSLAKLTGHSIAGLTLLNCLLTLHITMVAIEDKKKPLSNKEKLAHLKSNGTPAALAMLFVIGSFWYVEAPFLKEVFPDYTRTKVFDLLSQLW